MKKTKRPMRIYFSDYFNIDPKKLESYGAFNISIISDLPLFIDPFLLFESDKIEHQRLHKDILRYVGFLRDKALQGGITDGLLKHWFKFPEVKQNWLGYTEIGNDGRGLGDKFARALKNNLNTIFADFGNEKVTKGSHLEKLCLIKNGVGRDNISDFTTNLIKNYLLSYTEEFAKKNLKQGQLQKVKVDKAVFSYQSERWLPKEYTLPMVGADYAILTPKEILTKDENWINNKDFIDNFKDIAASIPNSQLREAIANYFERHLPEPKPVKKNRKPKPPSRKEVAEAIFKVIEKYPEFLDYYIKYKEDNGEQAKAVSEEKVSFSQKVFIDRIKTFIDTLDETTEFYKESPDSHKETLRRVQFLKSVIEHNNGYKIFYVDGQPIKREKDLQIMFRLTWFASSFDVNSEVDNGRGPVDYKISKGAANSSLVEFKLASNPQLKKNLQNQVEIYKKANKTKNAVKVILYFTDDEYIKTKSILSELKMDNDKNVVLIDARKSNKVSASKADNN